jgi:hypothetical protein
VPNADGGAAAVHKRLGYEAMRGRGIAYREAMYERCMNEYEVKALVASPQ